MDLTKEIEAVLDKCANDQVRDAYASRLHEGDLVRDENPWTHFCVFFVPFNSLNSKVLIGAHKKSGLWLMPGGHIDKNESLLETLNREIKEELGVEDFYREKPEPFLLTITQIVTDVRPCRKHYDMWFVMETSGSRFKIDYTEYHEVRWVDFTEAYDLVTDPANILALTALEDR